MKEVVEIRVALQCAALRDNGRAAVDHLDQVVGTGSQLGVGRREVLAVAVPAHLGVPVDHGEGGAQLQALSGAGTCRRRAGWRGWARRFDVDDTGSPPRCARLGGMLGRLESGGRAGMKRQLPGRPAGTLGQPSKFDCARRATRAVFGGASRASLSVGGRIRRRAPDLRRQGDQKGRGNHGKHGRSMAGPRASVHIGAPRAAQGPEMSGPVYRLPVGLTTHGVAAG